MIPFLHDNQFATGLIATVVLAAIMAYMRNVPPRLWRFLWSQFAVCAEIKNTDQSFNWISVWLDQHPYSRKTRRLAVYTFHNEDEELLDEKSGRQKKNRPKVLFTPAQGEHVFWYKGRLIWLSRSKSEPVHSSKYSSPIERESFNMWVIGRSQDLIREIVKDAMEMALPEGAPETRVIPSSMGSWQNAIRRKPRLRNSVILEDGAIDLLIEDVRKFLNSKRWYADLGIPYRRGYLLYGVPGSGKTSAVLAVAGELGLDVYMLNLGDRYLADGRLNYLLAQVPPGNIILLEDIDAAFPQKTSVTQGESRPKREMEAAITFSGLLNALDGVAAREGHLLFMTTNHKDALDPALIRPGRADVHLEFGYATASQAEKMFLRFFPAAGHELAARFGRMTPRNTVSMAAIQDHLLRHKNNPIEAFSTWAQPYQRS